jgi:hypothetical protein
VPTDKTSERLATIAQDQWGLITRRQAARAGVSPATIARLTANGGALERIAAGVFHLAGAPWPEHVGLRAAWLQLAPAVFAWDRTESQGVVSHRSAAALYGIGDLPADTHEFTMSTRRQTRRTDVRLHIREVGDDWIGLRGLPVTRPSRIAADLLGDRQDPESVARIVADATRHLYDYPGSFADALAPLAHRFGLARGDGLAFLGWLYDLVGDPEREIWMKEAQATYGVNVS